MLKLTADAEKTFERLLMTVSEVHSTIRLMEVIRTVAQGRLEVVH